VFLRSDDVQLISRIACLYITDTNNAVAGEPPGTMNRVSQSPHVKCTGYLHEKLPYCGLCGPTPAVTLGLTEHHLHRHIITCAGSCLRNPVGCKYETNESKSSHVVGVTSLTLYSLLVNTHTTSFNILLTVHLNIFIY